MATKSNENREYNKLLKDMRKIIREEVGNEVQASKEELDSTIRESRMRIQTDIMENTDRIKNLEIRVTKNHKEVLSKLKITSDFHDQVGLNLAKRVKKIEQHLILPKSS